MIMEMSLKRLDGVDRVAISASRQMFVVFYTEGASFNPKGMRDAVGNASVKVLRFHVQGQGKIQQEGDKQFMVVNKDRFLLVDSPDIPANTQVGFIGSVNDAAQPWELKIDDWKAVSPEAKK